MVKLEKNVASETLLLFPGRYFQCVQKKQQQQEPRILKVHRHTTEATEFYAVTIQHARQRGCHYTFTNYKPQSSFICTRNLLLVCSIAYQKRRHNLTPRMFSRVANIMDSQHVKPILKVTIITCPLIYSGKSASRKLYLLYTVTG